MISRTLQTQQMPASLGYQWEANLSDHILLVDAVGPPVRLPLMLASAPKVSYPFSTLLSSVLIAISGPSRSSACDVSDHARKEKDIAKRV